MRWLNIFLVIIVNIFLTLVVSMTLEYLGLAQRMQQLENTISTSVETALDTSMMSEEFFSESYSSNMLSHSGTLTGGGSSDTATSNLRWYSDGRWITANTYAMAMYHDFTGGMPESQSVLANYINKTSGQVYHWIFQETVGTTISQVNDLDEPGNVYDYWMLAWAANNQNTKNAIHDMGINPTGYRDVASDFKLFYDNVGKYITMPTAVKVKIGNTYQVQIQNVPVLCHTGLLLDSMYNDTSSTIINDNFIQVTKVGKKRITPTGATAYSRYYLTPYSLGVTYVPIKVFEPILMSHLQQTILMNRLVTSDYAESGGSIVDDTTKKILDAGIGCLETSIYPNGTETEPIQHATGASEQYYNDGDIEYNLDDIKIDVDYSIVDFYDPANAEIVGRILGKETGDISGEETVADLAASDSSGTGNGDRVVARVTVSVKVNIPYQSPLLQWIDYLKGEAIRSKSHYGVKMWNTSTNSIYEDSDGIWFKYTTYRAISR